MSCESAQIIPSPTTIKIILNALYVKPHPDLRILFKIYLISEDKKVSHDSYSILPLNE